MNKKIIWTVVIVLLILLLLGIFRDSEDSRSDEIVKIGVITDLSSSAAGVYGEPLKKGVDLAVSELGSNDRKYSVLYQDYRLDAKLALPSYEALKSEGVRIFIVDGSPALGVLAPEVKKDGHIMLNPSSFIPSYKDSNPLTCRIAMTTDTYGPAYADLALTKLEFKNVALLMPNYVAGIALRDAITAEITKNGGTVVASELYLNGDSDFRTQLTKIKSIKNLDALITVNYFTSVGTLFAQIENLGIKVPVLTDDWTVSNQALTSLKQVEGVYFVGYPYSGDDPTTELAKTYFDMFTKRYGESPKLEAVMGYDLVHIINKAIKNTSSVEPLTIANHIVSDFADYDAVSGKLSFNSDCEVDRDAVYRKVMSGKFVPVQ